MIFKIRIAVLFYTISIFVSREVFFLIGYSLIVGMVLEYGRVELLFSIIAIPFIIWLVYWIYLQQKQKKNLEKPLINKEYGRCKDCMSPDISLLKKENIITGYQHQKLDGTRDYRYKDNQAFYRTVLYYKCNDCSLEFTNRERE